MYCFAIKFNPKIIGIILAGNSRLPSTQKIIQKGVGVRFSVGPTLGLTIYFCLEEACLEEGQTRRPEGRAPLPRP